MTDDKAALAAAAMIRPIRIDGLTAFVPLTQGYHVVIDAADVPLVAGRNWRAIVGRRKDGSVQSVYAARWTTSNGRKVYVMMHRVISGVGQNSLVDHIDGNGLNNRRENLRPANRAENNQNRKMSHCNTSGFKGVTWAKSRNKWRAQIRANGKKIYIGDFSSPEAAHAAYCAASRELHGEFGRTV